LGWGVLKRSTNEAHIGAPKPGSMKLY
jgi:hypothetical protein